MNDETKLCRKPISIFYRQLPRLFCKIFDKYAAKVLKKIELSLKTHNYGKISSLALKSSQTTLVH